MRDLLRFALVGVMAGWIAAILVRGRARRGLGLFGYMATGMVGAVIGGFLFEQLGIHGGVGFWGSVVTATVGAVVLLVGIRLLRSL